MFIDTLFNTSWVISAFIFCISLKAYRSIIPEDRFEEKYRDMYLDNNSTANSSVYVNGQLLHMKFDVNGNVRFSANPTDLGIY